MIIDYNLIRMDTEYSPGAQYISQYAPNPYLNVYIIYTKYHTKASVTKDEDGYQGKLPFLIFYFIHLKYNPNSFMFAFLS